MPRPMLFLTLFLLAAPLAAQTRDPDIGRIKPEVGVHYSRGMGPTVHLALFRVDGVTIHNELGKFVGIEPGLWGGRIGVGTASIGGMGGGTLRLSYLRTWGDGELIAPDQGFIGADLRLILPAVYATVGAGWNLRVSGDRKGDGSFITLSGGFGF